MTDRVADIESLLRQAQVPIDPPAELEARLEETLGSLVGMAADELDSWELSAVKDPKNWIRLARPAAAVVIGSGAAVGLVLVRTQRKRHGRRLDSVNRLDLIGRTMRDLSREARRVIDDVF